MTNDNKSKTGSPALPEPTWEFPSGEEHVDLIGYADPGLVYLYLWEPLDAEGLGTYGLKRLMLGPLGVLGKQNKRLRDRAFTVFAGDLWPDCSRLGIGVTATDGNLANFLRELWQKPRMSGPHLGDMASLKPFYRYDHGHIIEYSENWRAGTTRIDGVDDCETGLTLHVRRFRRTRGKPMYGKLVEG